MPAYVSFDETGYGELSVAEALDIPYPDWQIPYRDAILELDPAKMRQRMAEVEEVISIRLREHSPDQHERRALMDALTILQSLKRLR